MNEGECYEIGTGAADITAAFHGVAFIGYQIKEQRSQGVRTRLHARAIVLKSTVPALCTIDPNSVSYLAIVSIEYMSVSNLVKELVLRRLQREPELMDCQFGHRNLWISATHTHSAPGGFDVYYQYAFPDWGDLIQPVTDTVVNGMVAAIRSAVRNMRLGKVYVNSGDLPWKPPSHLSEEEVARLPPDAFWTRNRTYGEFDHTCSLLGCCNSGRNLPTPFDRKMQVLKFTHLRSPGGKERDAEWPVGMLMIFCTHCTVFGQFNRLISSDVLGYVSLDVESEVYHSHARGNFFVDTDRVPEYLGPTFSDTLPGVVGGGAAGGDGKKEVVVVEEEEGEEGKGGEQQQQQVRVGSRMKAAAGGGGGLQETIKVVYPQVGGGGGGVLPPVFPDVVIQVPGGGGGGVGLLPDVVVQVEEEEDSEEEGEYSEEEEEEEESEGEEESEEEIFIFPHERTHQKEKDTSARFGFVCLCMPGAQGDATPNARQGNNWDLPYLTWGPKRCLRLSQFLEKLFPWNCIRSSHACGWGTSQSHSCALFGSALANHALQLAHLIPSVPSPDDGIPPIRPMVQLRGGIVCGSHFEKMTNLGVRTHKKNQKKKAGKNPQHELLYYVGNRVVPTAEPDARLPAQGTFGMTMIVGTIESVSPICIRPGDTTSSMGLCVRGITVCIGNEVDIDVFPKIVALDDDDTLEGCCECGEEKKRNRRPIPALPRVMEYSVIRIGTLGETGNESRDECPTFMSLNVPFEVTCRASAYIRKSVAEAIEETFDEETKGRYLTLVGVCNDYGSYMADEEFCRLAPICCCRPLNRYVWPPLLLCTHTPQSYADGSTLWGVHQMKAVSGILEDMSVVMMTECRDMINLGHPALSLEYYTQLLHSDTRFVYKDVKQISSSLANKLLSDKGGVIQGPDPKIVLGEDEQVECVFRGTNPNAINTKIFGARVNEQLTLVKIQRLVDEKKDKWMDVRSDSNFDLTWQWTRRCRAQIGQVRARWTLKYLTRVERSRLVSGRYRFLHQGIYIIPKPGGLSISESLSQVENRKRRYVICPPAAEFELEVGVEGKEGVRGGVAVEMMERGGYWRGSGFL